MNKLTFIKIAMTSVFFSSLSTVASADQEKRKIVYSGDESVRGICTSIAKDQVSRLKRSLNSEKISMVDNKVHTRFTCNKQDLLTFALEMGAENTTIYLAEKFGKTQEPMSIVSK